MCPSPAHSLPTVPKIMTSTQIKYQFKVMDGLEDDPINFNNDSFLNMLTSLDNKIGQIDKRLSEISSH